MGSAECREGRRASFGMDEEERVRVLQGIRVSGRPAGGRLDRDPNCILSDTSAFSMCAKSASVISDYVRPQGL